MLDFYLLVVYNKFQSKFVNKPQNRDSKLESLIINRSQQS